MSSERLEQVQTEYRKGRAAFERGRYRQSVEHFETARNLVEKNTRLGGEVQIWLASAYQALGQNPSAIALCRQLKNHPHWDTRKQSRRLLEILEAPELKSNLKGVIKIPDMSEIEENERPIKVSQTTSSKARRPSTPPAPPEPLDPAEVNDQENGFLFVALIAIAIILGGLFLT